MYTQGEHSLGQAPQEKPWYSGILDLAKEGYGIYAQREQQQSAQDIAVRKAEASVKIAAMQSGLVPSGFSRFIPTSIRTTIQRVGGGSDWIMPVAIGVAGLGVLFFVMKK